VERFIFTKAYVPCHPAEDPQVEPVAAVHKHGGQQGEVNGRGAGILGDFLYLAGAGANRKKHGVEV
jgi:hypothetical protein